MSISGSDEFSTDGATAFLFRDVDVHIINAIPRKCAIMILYSYLRYEREIWTRSES